MPDWRTRITKSLPGCSGRARKRYPRPTQCLAARVVAIRLGSFNLLISVFMFMLVGKLSKVDYSTCIW